MYQIYSASTAAMHAEADYRAARLAGVAGSARRFARRSRRAQEAGR